MTGSMLMEPELVDNGRQRFLLTGVVNRYHRDPSWNREELAGDLERMVALFTGEMGYEHVPVMGLDPTWLQIQDALRRDFCTSPDPVFLQPPVQLAGQRLLLRALAHRGAHRRISGRPGGPS